MVLRQVEEVQVSGIAIGCSTELTFTIGGEMNEMATSVLLPTTLFISLPKAKDSSVLLLMAMLLTWTSSTCLSTMLSLAN